MVEKPTAATTTDDAQQQGSGGSTVSKPAGGEAYPGQDKAVLDHLASRQWDETHGMEWFKNEWNKQHPDHPFANASELSDAIRAALLRDNGRPEAVAETMRQLESFDKP